MGHLSSSGQQLMSVKEGWKIRNVSLAPTEVLSYTRFENFEEDEEVDIVRFDNFGLVVLGEGPFIISSRLPTPTDSLGLIALKLDGKEMSSFVSLIKDLSTGFLSPKGDTHSFRVTYRLKGNDSCYYVKNSKECAIYFKAIERTLVKKKSSIAGDTFYRFMEQAGLVTMTVHGPEWLY